MNKINEHMLKITGAATLEEELTFGKDYKLDLVGSVISIKEKDNDDGTVDRTYSLRLANAIIQDERKSILVKDKTRQSQMLRGAIYHLQQEVGSQEGEEEFYARVMATIRANLSEIYQRYGRA
ncbi:MAG: hypothetical protein AB9866_18905 [Syntrophobacteraceae bacterium]